jgi:hypothetical protein
MAVSVNLYPSIFYYFVFEDGALGKVIPHRIPDISKGPTEDPSTMDGLVDLVPQTPGVSWDGFGASVEAASKEYESFVNKTMKKMEADGYTEPTAEELRGTELMERFDASRISLGDTADMVAKQLGLPHTEELRGGLIASTYGPDAAFQYFRFSAPRITILYDKDKRGAAEVYTRYRTSDGREHLH